MHVLALFGTSNLVGWGLKEILPVILLVIGIGIIARSRSGRLSENAATVSNVVLGVVVITSAGAIMAFAGQLSDLLTK